MGEGKISRIFVSLFIALLLLASKSIAQPDAAKDLVVIRGTVIDGEGRPVQGAEVRVFLNHGKIAADAAVSSSSSGDYKVEVALPPGSLPGAFIEVQASRSNYRVSQRLPVMNVIPAEAKAAHSFSATSDIILARMFTPATWIAGSILGLVFLLIAFGVIHRTLAAFLGATIILIITHTIGTFNPDYVLLPFDQAVRAIDMDVIFLLLSMMIIVGILKKTGLFQWMAYKSYQLARGNVFVLLGLLMLISGILSAFLDNVTTMLLVIPVSVEIALALRIDPMKLLVPEVFASNVGGTATLIGDPPNIMIGSYAHLSFVDFGRHLLPICTICLAFAIVYFAWWFRSDYAKAGNEIDDVDKMIEQLRSEYRITDRKLLTQGLIILGLTILLFILHGFLGMAPCIAAMAGAAMFMVVSKVDIVEMIEREIEWPTLIFFAMLFIIVAAAMETGIIQAIADWIKSVSGGSPIFALMVIFWLSAIASALIDNIPFTATMLPIVAYLNTTVSGAQKGTLWWALALGACLGGNATMIGASANVITAGIAERAGYGISFAQYFKIVAIPTFLTLLLSIVWLLVFET